MDSPISKKVNGFELVPLGLWSQADCSYAMSLSNVVTRQWSEYSNVKPEKIVCKESYLSFNIQYFEKWSVILSGAVTGLAFRQISKAIDRHFSPNDKHAFIVRFPRLLEGLFTEFPTVVYKELKNFSL